MWGGHGSTGNSVDSVLAADPGGEDVQAWCKDVVALAKVGEIGTLVSESGSTNSDGLLSGSWGVVARVGIVVTGSNSEVDTSVDSGIHGSIKSWGLATTKRHVGS